MLLGGPPVCFRVAAIRCHSFFVYLRPDRSGLNFATMFSMESVEFKPHQGATPKLRDITPKLRDITPKLRDINPQTA